MKTGEGVAYARAGLLGNPGDGYEGQALATTIYDFRALVSAQAGEGFRIHPNPEDGLGFPSLGEAMSAFTGGGCDDGLRLLRAGVRRFGMLAKEAGLSEKELSSGVHLHYETTIPRQVGLSGSSALIIATMRALGRLFNLRMDPFDLSEAALAAEVEDLGIPAGPMDRVVQSYEGTVVMDLEPPRTPDRIRAVSPSLLPSTFIAWTPHVTKSSGRLHRRLRERWEEGDPDVLDVLGQLRGLVDLGMEDLERGDHEAFGRRMAHNFELRCRIFTVSDVDRAMVRLAREFGCAAKLAGSGGAIVGLLPSGTHATDLEAAFRSSGWSFLRPNVTAPA